MAHRRPKVSRLLPLAIAAAGLLSAQPPAGLNLAGAAHIHEGRIRLTSAKRHQSGAAWQPDKQPVSMGFETTFQFQLTQFGGLGPGADGLAFVIQSSGPRALAGHGAAGGFALGNGSSDSDSPAIPNSLAVFFDTYQNGEARDPSDNFIVIAFNGRVGRQKWPPSRLGITRKLPVFMKNGKVHSARILYQPPLLSIFLDGREAPVLSAPVELPRLVSEDGRAWVGFTASTGNGFENHDILDWSFKPLQSDVSSTISHVSSTISFLSSPCLPDRNLCTPEESMVEQKSPGEFHVVLPAHLEWGASIPNPASREVTIAGTLGTACSGADKTGAVDCAPKLIHRNRNGRTEFSIEFPARTSARSNQGYLEFDVRLR